MFKQLFDNSLPLWCLKLFRKICLPRASLIHTWKALSLPAAAICLILSIPMVLNAGQDTITNDAGMTFIRVEPGTFTMGSLSDEAHRDQDETRHQVVIEHAFYLQDSEVTQAQWQKVMGRRWFVRHRPDGRLPQTRICFYSCMKFIKKLNKSSQHKYRLPSEAEWEYACRAGSTTAFAFGDSIDCSQAMFANNPDKDGTCVAYYKTLGISPQGPAPVKTFAPNAWGFYDMHGNVWEWCADVYAPYGENPVTPSFFSTKAASRVRRGGSFYKHASSLRSANRTYGHPAARYQTTGFRLVLEAGK